MVCLMISMYFGCTIYVYLRISGHSFMFSVFRKDQDSAKIINKTIMECTFITFLNVCSWSIVLTSVFQCVVTHTVDIQSKWISIQESPLPPPVRKQSCVWVSLLVALGVVRSTKQGWAQLLYRDKKRSRTKMPQWGWYILKGYRKQT